ncbi:hypothetical protein [Myroides sp. N17-2]|uniref:hypothetical protein n=1 Tax=Myroides sp. N17-2 TaxID=2030799 RepID=UPI000EFA48EB|nr:hypothetical protein [Myroides sp. N17-2]
MKYIYSLLVFFLFSIFSFGQIAVNRTLPSVNSALHVEASAKGKGMLIPRLTEAQRNAIVTTQSEDGLTIYNIDEDCLNYWNKIDNQWKSVCGKVGKSEFTITDCNKIKVYGIYKDKIPLSNEHFITMEVDVKKIGTYSIMASSTPHNGYYYAVSGEFLSIGKYTINVPAAGEPMNFGTDTFKVYLNDLDANGLQPACTFKVKVEDTRIKPDFRMRCGDTKVVGVYKLDQPLDQSHYIEVTIDADASAMGATLVIETNEVDGIYFKGSEEITKTRQVIRLQGYGVSNTTSIKKFTIKTNSTLTNAVCYANVRVLIPTKRIVSIGIGKNGFGYNWSGPSSASNKLVAEIRNYGNLPTSVIGYEGKIVIEDGGATASVAKLTEWLEGPNPIDILILGYDWNMNAKEAEVVGNYLLKGGVVLAYCESNSGMTALMAKLTGGNSVTAVKGGTAGTIYKFSNIDDPILNGPFGDIRGKQWGEDASRTTTLVGVDTSSIMVYSDAYNWSSDAMTSKGGLTAFRHKDFNLIWTGDGGFNSDNGGVSNTICPFKLDANNYPIAKPVYGNGKLKLPVYNSVFTANAFAWALMQAEKNGINSNK